MTCRIADNPALERLRVDIGAPKLCHSQRVDCVHRLPRSTGGGHYGIAGAFMGYCQALFAFKGPLRSNTDRITALLESASLPWSRSHELFFGHKGSETVSAFVGEAATPLRELGRVPILITSLDPATALSTFEDIFTATVDVVPGETVLVRMLASSNASFEIIERLIRGLVEAAQRTKAMPQWWPLLQVTGSANGWQAFRDRLGPLWRYVNVAVTPYTDAVLWEIVREQIMVAQFVVPRARDILANGDVRLSDGMRMSGAVVGQLYNIRDFVGRISALETWPTCIFLGPALEGWTDEENLERVRKAVAVFTDEVQQRWLAGGLEKYRDLLSMAA